jgi:mannose-6-phosphate isomerase-like protein (cupin superfamily)
LANRLGVPFVQVTYQRIVEVLAAMKVGDFVRFTCCPYLVPVVFTVCEEATMARGSKVFRPADVSESNASGYPELFREGQRKRHNRRLGDHAGLNNYGVNLIRVLPGGQSSARHAHSEQDEFVYVLEGEFVLVTDAGRETVEPGTCIGFPA